jgi:hypothetical protein
MLKSTVENGSGSNSLGFVKRGCLAALPTSSSLTSQVSQMYRVTSSPGGSPRGEVNKGTFIKGDVKADR